jgi:small subunit ribosomal protein S14
MAKKSSVEKNNRRKKMIKANSQKRALLKKRIMDKTCPIEERLQLVQKLAKVSRNSSSTRYRNRCELTGRPRGYYREFGLSRSALRELASFGRVPGLTKSSW